MKLNNWNKAILLIVCFTLSVIGFLIKLPSAFRHIDKELHAIFYFSAAAFLSLLFANKNILRHILIFISLYIYSFTIEYAQAFSNKFFHKKIHGHFDVEDMQANLKGLVYFSIAWIIYNSISYLYSILQFNKNNNS